MDKRQGHHQAERAADGTCELMDSSLSDRASSGRPISQQACAAQARACTSGRGPKAIGSVPPGCSQASRKWSKAAADRASWAAEPPLINWA